MPSGPAATPSVNMHPPSKTRSILTPAGSMPESPCGAGKPGSSARTGPDARVPTTAKAYSTHQFRFLIVCTGRIDDFALRSIFMTIPLAFSSGFKRWRGRYNAWKQQQETASSDIHVSHGDEQLTEQACVAP